MSRTIGSSGVKTLEAIREAGLRLIYEQGFEAMTLRDLAATVGIQQGSLYNYFRTKQDLLFTLVSDHMNNLLAELEAALAGKLSSRQALEAFIAFHIGYHINRKHEVFINYSELRSFDAENYRAIIVLRRRYEQKLIGLIEAAQQDGHIARQDARIAAFGILSMLTGICQWFRPDGRLPRETVIETYTAMALGALGIPAKAPTAEPENEGKRNSMRSPYAIPATGRDQ